MELKPKSCLVSWKEVFGVCLFVLFVFSCVEAQEEDIFKLEEVVVTATKTEHTLGDVPVAAEVITREELEKRGVKTAQEALELLSGIKVNKNVSHWGDKGKVEIYGLEARHTLILVDGQRILGGHADAVDLQQISTEMIERIEIVKGPASALYGSDAMGGVINIITKSAPKKPTISVSPSFGSRERQIYEVSGGAKSGKFGSFLNYTYRRSSGIHEEFDEYWESIFQGTFSYDFTPHLKFSLKPYFSRHKMKHEGRTQERYGINSIWEWSPNKLSKLTIRGSWFNYKHWTSDHKSNWHTDSYEGEINYNRVIANIHTLTLGYQYWKEDIDDRGKAYRADQETNSFFIQDEIDLSPFIFVLGVRADYHDRWGTEVNPKLSLLYKVTKNFKLRASVGRAFRGPSLVKLYAEGWRMGPYIVHANPDLDPEKSWGYQLGADYKFSEKLLAKLTLFRNDIKDLIEAKIVRPRRRPPWHMYWENIREAKTQGIDFSLVSKITNNLSARLGYTFLDTEDKTSDRELTYKPRHKLTLEFGYKIPQINLNINLECEYIGKRYDSDYQKLPDYTIVNLALTKDIRKIAEIFARIDNLFNKKDIEDEYDIDGIEILGGIKMKF